MNILGAFQRTLPSTSGTALRRWLRHLTTFEKVIIANSVIIVLDTLAGWWITQHNPETYHYLIDTAFITLAALLGLLVNFLLLRAAFAPLRSLLATIQAVEHGQLEARVSEQGYVADVQVLAHAFNTMLDQLAYVSNESATLVLRAQEDERRRLALELHDQTGQSLTALALHAEAIAQRLAGESSTANVAVRQAQRQAEQLCMLAQRTLVEVQTLSRQLRPPMLDDLGLAAALRWLAEDAEQRLALHVRVVNRLAGRLPDEMETALFRIVQECLTNAVRHGHATAAACLLRQSDAALSMTVADNGQGFAALEDAHYWSHLHGQYSGGSGVEGMWARLRPLGGRLIIRSQPQHGCAVHVIIPFTQV